VELVGIEGDPHDPLLVTRRLEGHTLADGEPLTRAQAAGVTAALASTLADLHQLGIVHGAVAPEHVILGPDGRPVLCGFGYGGRAGATPSARPSVPSDFLDPRLGDADGLDLSIDVYALGALLRFLLRELPRNRPEPLLRLAEEATGTEVGRRPTAAALAKAINDTVPDARLPRVADEQLAPRAEALEALRHRQVTLRTKPSTNGVNKRGLALLASVATVLVAATIFGMNRLGGSGHTAARLPGADPDPVLPAVAPSTATLALTTTVAVPSTTLPAPDCLIADGPLAADTDGDGCLETLRYASGILTSGSARWSVGGDGDQVAIGDWVCRGQESLALLHPPTGDVFVFDGWARPGHDLVATRAARVDGAFVLRSANLGGGCPQLVVDRRAGPPVVVPAGTGE
ncbi:MAG TPA: hypothetical protein VF711_02835, partial [Acidimicrobiales bacterium]